MNSEWDPRASPGELGHLPSYLPSRASCCVPPPILVNSAMKQDKNILPVSPTGSTAREALPGAYNEVCHKAEPPNCSCYSYMYAQISTGEQGGHWGRGRLKAPGELQEGSGETRFMSGRLGTPSGMTDKTRQLAWLTSAKMRDGVGRTVGFDVQRSKHNHIIKQGLTDATKQGRGRGVSESKALDCSKSGFTASDTVLFLNKHLSDSPIFREHSTELSQT